MPHADSSLVPEDIETKTAFYEHVLSALRALLDDSTYWVANLAQVAALLYHSYASTPLYGLQEDHKPVVNWVGFYLYPPSSSLSPPAPVPLGPYQGRPACISITPLEGRGVCADVFTSGQSVVVPDVEAYPGHIACDGDTKSEIVLPLIIDTAKGKRVIGVLDLDSTGLSIFDEDDRIGLQRIVDMLQTSCEWA